MPWRASSSKLASDGMSGRTMTISVSPVPLVGLRRKCCSGYKSEIQAKSFGTAFFSVKTLRLPYDVTFFTSVFLEVYYTVDEYPQT